MPPLATYCHNASPLGTYERRDTDCVSLREAAPCEHAGLVAQRAGDEAVATAQSAVDWLLTDVRVQMRRRPQIRTETAEVALLRKRERRRHEPG